jgi:Mce-associated membrane protein
MTTVQDSSDRAQEQIEDHTHDLKGSGPTGLPVRAMTLVLLGVAVLSLIAIVAEVIWLRPRHDDLEQRRVDRSAVIAATQRFVTAANTYTPATFEDMTKHVRTMLSTKLRTSFDASNQDLGGVIHQTGLSSKGSVLKTGVASLDEDSAVVLVVADADTTSKAQNSIRHFRWEVDLVKVDGDWLIDDFSAVVDPAMAGAQP